jgi:hypothetical protein
MITGYRGHGKRWGKINFGNGFTLRFGRLAFHFWKAPDPKYYSGRTRS